MPGRAAHRAPAPCSLPRWSGLRSWRSAAGVTPSRFTRASAWPFTAEWSRTIVWAKGAALCCSIGRGPVCRLPRRYLPRGVGDVRDLGIAGVSRFMTGAGAAIKSTCGSGAKKEFVDHDDLLFSPHGSSVRCRPGCDIMGYPGPDSSDAPAARPSRSRCSFKIHGYVAHAFGKHKRIELRVSNKKVVVRKSNSSAPAKFRRRRRGRSDRAGPVPSAHVP